MGGNGGVQKKQGSHQSFWAVNMAPTTKANNYKESHNQKARKQCKQTAIKKFLKKYRYIYTVNSVDRIQKEIISHTRQIFIFRINNYHRQLR